MSSLTARLRGVLAAAKPPPEYDASRFAIAALRGRVQILTPTTFVSSHGTGGLTGRVQIHAYADLNKAATSGMTGRTQIDAYADQQKAATSGLTGRVTVS